MREATSPTLVGPRERRIHGRITPAIFLHPSNLCDVLFVNGWRGGIGKFRRAWVVLGGLGRVPVRSGGVSIIHVLDIPVNLERRRGKHFVGAVCWGPRIFQRVKRSPIRLELWVLKETRVKWNFTLNV
jgi:hypothetical protein